MLGILTTSLVTLVGFLFSLVIFTHGGSSVRTTWLRALAFAPGVGAGWISLSVFFLLHFGLQKVFLWPLVVLPAGAAAVYLVRVERSRSSQLPNPDTRTAAGFRGNVLSSCYWLLVLALIYVMFAHAWIVMKRQPLGGFDAVAIWNAHAVFLYRPVTGFQELFYTLEQGHPEYPLLLPGAVAGQFLLRGGEDPAIPQMVAAFFLLGLVLMIYESVSDLGSRSMALPAVVVTLSTPVFSKFAFSQAADLPVAYLALGAAFGLWSRLPGGSGSGVPPILAGLFVGLLAWTKNEGAVLSALLVVIFSCLYLIACRRRDGEENAAIGNWRKLAVVAVGALPGFAALALFRIYWVSSKEASRFVSDVFSKVTDFDRWETVLRFLFCRLAPFCEPDRWGFFWVLCLAGGIVILWKKAHSFRHTYVILSFLAGISVYLSSYLISPYGLEWHIGSSIDRILMQLAPLLAVWVFGSVVMSPSGARAPDAGLEEGGARAGKE